MTWNPMAPLEWWITQLAARREGMTNSVTQHVWHMALESTSGGTFFFKCNTCLNRWGSCTAKW